MENFTMWSTGNNDTTFEKKGGCLNYNTFAEETSFHLMSAAGQKRKRPNRRLIELDLTTSRRKWICSACLEYCDRELVKSCVRQPFHQ